MRARTQLMAVTAFVRDNKLSDDLAVRVQGYFKHAYSTQNRWMMLNSYDSSEIFKELSSELRSEVICFVERGIADKIPFLGNKSNKFRAEFILLLEPVGREKGDYIIRRGSNADAMYIHQSFAPHACNLRSKIH